MVIVCALSEQGTRRWRTLVRHLAFLKQLIQYHVSLFGIFVVFERLGEIIQRALALSLLGIVLGDAVVGPRVLIVGLEGTIEGFVGGLHMLSAQRQPAECRMRRTEVWIGDESCIIFFLCQVQTAPGFIEIS